MYIAADFTASPGESSVSVSSSRIGGLPPGPIWVWCTDVTYIPMRPGLLYLVAIMDWSQPLDFVLEAVEHAGAVLLWRTHSRIALNRYDPPDAIFNTDQGKSVHQHGVHGTTQRGRGA